MQEFLETILSDESIAAYNKYNRSLAMDRLDEVLQEKYPLSEAFMMEMTPSAMHARMESDCYPYYMNISD